MYWKGVDILQPFNHFMWEMYCSWAAPKMPSCSELRATRNFAVFRIFLWFWNFCKALNLHKSAAKVLANRKRLFASSGFVCLLWPVTYKCVRQNHTFHLANIAHKCNRKHGTIRVFMRKDKLHAYRQSARLFLISS